MIYLPLYVTFEYANLEECRNHVFYSIPESRWYLTDTSIPGTMYQNALPFDGITPSRRDGKTDIGPPTTFKKTNERIREVLRVIYEDKPIPENIQTPKKMEFTASLIRGKKTKRICFGIKSDSDMRVPNVNPHNIDRDSWMFTIKTTPIYRTFEKYTACIYSWHVKYKSPENFGYYGRFVAPREVDDLALAANNVVSKKQTEPYEESKSKDGILDFFVVDFDYVTKDGCLKRIHAVIKIHDDCILDVQREGCELNAQFFSLNGEVCSSYVSFPVRKRRIPTNLISEPNMKKAKDVIAFFIREYFDL